VSEHLGQEPRLTTAARARLEGELERLREERSQLVASLSFDETRGDSADQAAAVERGAELERVDHRIEELGDLLNDSKRAAPPTGEEVEVGTLVTLEFGDGDTETVQVGMKALQDQDDISVLTPDSPLGRAILGRRAGDTVTYTTPRGESEAKVLTVRVAEH
jgi:transcription elongation GreA/GreB family factor